MTAPLVNPPNPSEILKAVQEEIRTWQKVFNLDIPEGRLLDLEIVLAGRFCEILIRRLKEETYKEGSS